MTKRKNKKKIDKEAKLFMSLLHLREEKEKKYSFEECEKSVVYLFDNYEEFKSYFEVNGFANVDKDLLELCIMKTTRKGTIIALKGLCDHAIRKHNSHTIVSSVHESQQFDVLAVPCNRSFVVAPEKAEEFKNLSSNPEIIHQMEENFRISNLVRRRIVFEKK